MKYFLETSTTIPDGVGFSHFSLCHLLWLAAFAVITITVSIIYKKANTKLRRRIQ